MTVDRDGNANIVYGTRLTGDVVPRWIRLALY